MMTQAEARLRMQVHNARFSKRDDEYRVVLNDWRGAEVERKAYYTNDLEDAVLTAGAMRRHAVSLKAELLVPNQSLG